VSVLDRQPVLGHTVRFQVRSILVGMGDAGHREGRVQICIQANRSQIGRADDAGEDALTAGGHNLFEHDHVSRYIVQHRRYHQPRDARTNDDNPGPMPR